MKLAAAWMMLLVWSVGCGASTAEIKLARDARYNADVATIAPAISRVMHDRVRSTEGGRQLDTAWRQVSVTGNGEGSSGEVSGQMQAGHTRTAVDPSTNRAAVNRYFERYSIRIVGDQPFSVDVQAYAAKWSPGYAEPTVLNGDARPDWLEDRRSHVILAIHKELQPYEVHEAATTAPAR